MSGWASGDRGVCDEGMWALMVKLELLDSGRGDSSPPPLSHIGQGGAQLISNGKCHSLGGFIQKPLSECSMPAEESTDLPNILMMQQCSVRPQQPAKRRLGALPHSPGWMDACSSSPSSHWLSLWVEPSLFFPQWKRKCVQSCHQGKGWLLWRISYKI